MREIHFLIIRFAIIVITLTLLGLYYVGVFSEDVPLFLTYILLGLTLAIVLVFGVRTYSYKKNIRNFFIGFLVLILIFGLSFLFSSDAVHAPVYQRFSINALESRLIGAIITSTIIMCVFAVVFIAVFGAIEYFKKRSSYEQ